MSTVFGLNLYLEIGPKRIGKFSAFEITRISFAIQMLYYWMCSVSPNPTALYSQLIPTFKVLDIATRCEAE